MKGRLVFAFEWRQTDLFLNGVKVAQLIGQTANSVYVYSRFPGLQSHHTGPHVVHRNVPLDVVSCMMARFS